MITFAMDTNQRKPFELPGAKPNYNPHRPGQVKHIFLDLKLNLEQQSFQGICCLTLQPIRPGINQLILDAVNLRIDLVLIKNMSQSFDYDGEKLTVYLLQALAQDAIDLEIHYHVHQPQRGLYFIAPDDHYPQKATQVWTQGEDEDSRYWFPCFDYPGQLATSEIRLEVPKPYKAISNGNLIQIEDKGNTQIFHWSQEQIHPTYLMTLAVGDFVELQAPDYSLPVLYYVEKGREADAWRSLGKTPKMIDFFTETFGYPYPYPKYAQVCVEDFIFGGMENTSTTLLMDRCLLDERAALDNRNTESLVAYEVAHQWFGDLVVIKHWSHAWIKEGMASYAEVLWTEFEYNQEEAAYYLLGEARNYLEEDSSRYRRPMVTHVYRDAIELYDRHLYEKGACVYHMIRAILGDELFTKAIHTFVQDHAYQTVETIDLLCSIEKATGFNLLWLFNQYVYRGGHPDYKVSYSWEADSALAKLTVRQTQAKPDSNHEDLFDLTLPVAFNFQGQEITRKVFNLAIKEREQCFYFPLDRKPDFISFDVGNAFLKTVELDYPTPELKAQLHLDPDPIARIYAAIALAKKGGLDILQSFQSQLKNESFWAVRAEIAEQLAKIKLDQTALVLMESLKTEEHPKVRKAILNSLSQFKILPAYETLKSCLVQGETSYYTEAEAARGLGAMLGSILKDKEAEVIALLQQILETRSGWNEVVRCGAVGGLSQLKTSAEAAKILMQYTALGVPQPLRLAAIRALGPVSTGQSPEPLTAILDCLTAIAQETFFLTQVAVTTALSNMETPQAIGILQGLANQTPDGRARRLAEEAITKVQSQLGTEKSLQELREVVEQLKQENQDLKSRLTKLEAQQPI
ncbi:MAG: M1 family metallopeptidase [Merismopediaceae bacterium]|nr:M1 family metallopeptidase [Merismopediaceae bacterium]